MYNMDNIIGKGCFYKLMYHYNLTSIYIKLYILSKNINLIKILKKIINQHNIHYKYIKFVEIFILYQLKLIDYKLLSVLRYKNNYIDIHFHKNDYQITNYDKKINKTFCKKDVNIFCLIIKIFFENMNILLIIVFTNLILIFVYLFYNNIFIN